MYIYTSLINITKILSTYVYYIYSSRSQIDQGARGQCFLDSTCRQMPIYLYLSRLSAFSPHHHERRPYVLNTWSAGENARYCSHTACFAEKLTSNMCVSMLYTVCSRWTTVCVFLWLCQG